MSVAPDTAMTPSLIRGALTLPAHPLDAWGLKLTLNLCTRLLRRPALRVNRQRGQGMVARVLDPMLDKVVPIGDPVTSALG